MNLSRIFKKSDKLTTDDLVQRYQELQITKAELEQKAVELKQQALYAPVKELSAELADIRLQIELSEAALVEIQHRIEDLLHSQIEADHAALPERKAAYEANLARNFQGCGEALAKACHLLGLSRKAQLSSIAGSIQAGFAELASGPRAAEFGALVEAFNGFQPPSDAQDFRAERLDIETIERRAPGSPTAQNWINARLRRMLDLPTEKGV